MPPLLTTRSAVLLLIATMVGVVAGVLALFSSTNRNVPAAILVGGTAAGGALVTFQSLIGS